MTQSTEAFRILKKYVREHGAAKTAVVLNMVDTQAVRKWITLGRVPRGRELEILRLKTKDITVLVEEEEK